MGRTPIRLLFILCLGMVSISLTGCPLHLQVGGAEYRIIYPSGYIRDRYIRDNITAVEGTSYQLRCQKAEDYEKTYAYDLEILNENGEVLDEPRTPQMVFTIRLPEQVPAKSILRRSVDLSAK